MKDLTMAINFLKEHSPMSYIPEVIRRDSGAAGLESAIGRGLRRHSNNSKSLLPFHMAVRRTYHKMLNGRPIAAFYYGELKKDAPTEVTELTGEDFDLLNNSESKPQENK